MKVERVPSWSTWFAVRGFGVEGAAAARAAVSVAMVPMMMLLTSRTGSVGFFQLLGALWRPLVAALAMAFVVMAVPVPGIAMLALLAKVVLCALTYPGALLVLWQLSGRPVGFERDALAQLRAMLGKAAA